jgi:hypothetical protein
MAELEQEHQDRESELLEHRVRSYEERLDELSSTNSGLHEALRNQDAGVEARMLESMRSNDRLMPLCRIRQP